MPTWNHKWGETLHMIRGLRGCWYAKFLQVEHSATNKSMSLNILGQNMSWRALSLHMLLPRCPWWIETNITRRCDWGITTRIPLRSITETTDNLASSDWKLPCSGVQFCMQCRICYNFGYFSVLVPSQSCVVSLTSIASTSMACTSTCSEHWLPRGLGCTALDSASASTTILPGPYWRVKSVHKPQKETLYVYYRVGGGTFHIHIHSRPRAFFKLRIARFAVRWRPGNICHRTPRSIVQLQ